MIGLLILYAHSKFVSIIIPLCHIPLSLLHHDHGKWYFLQGTGYRECTFCLFDGIVQSFGDVRHVLGLK